MICRRVAIWYTQYNTFYSLKDVHKILKGKKYQGSESDVASRNQVNTNLALSLNEFPWNMTIEEKNWLLNVMKFNDIDTIEKTESAVLNEIQSRITLFLGPQVLDSMSKQEQFSKFFLGSRHMISSNFVLCKTFLYHLYNYLRDKKEFITIKALHEEVNKWIFINDKTLQLKKLKSFIEIFNKNLRLTKVIEKNAKVRAAQKEYSYIDIVLKVLPIIKERYKNTEFPWNKEREVNELQTTAFLFYHDETIDKSKLYSENEWAIEIFNYNKKYCKELYGHLGSPYDDIKVRSKKKKTDPSDNE